LEIPFPFLKVPCYSKEKFLPQKTPKKIVSTHKFCAIIISV
jgi:hypothetical protein